VDLKQAYRALDPAHPLEPDSPFYAPRPDNPIPLIITELQLADVPRRYLLTGHRGSGKTTELGRIAKALESTHIALVALFDSVPRSLDSVVSEVIAKAHIDKFGFHAPLDESIRSFTRPPVVLIDGVDKLDSRDVRDVLAGVGKLATWPISIVCTVPLTATLERDFGQIASSVDAWHFLPGISLWTQKGEPIEAGWALCREVIERRADGLFAPDALAVVVENSAGIHRELLRVAQRACALAAVANKPAIGAEEAARAVHELRNEYSIMLRSEDHARLREVERTGRISGDPELLRLVRDQFVVAYGSGGSWFAVHPMVKPLVSREQEAVGG
jgi:hypothetical protein